MKIFVTLALLVAIVLLCEKYENKLPRPLSWIFAGWKKFSHVLGLVMSTVILTVFWIIAIGSYAVIGKIIRLFRKKQSDTYWIPVEPHNTDSLKRQF